MSEPQQNTQEETLHHQCLAATVRTNHGAGLLFPMLLEFLPRDLASPIGRSCSAAALMSLAAKHMGQISGTRVSAAPWEETWHHSLFLQLQPSAHDARFLPGVPDWPEQALPASGMGKGFHGPDLAHKDSTY